jgi:hypothetical protein
MTVQMIIELNEEQGAKSILSAIETQKKRLQASILRTQRRLVQFERQYSVSTEQFLQSMSAEDLEGGDLEYVAWAGEAKLLASLESELAELEDVRYQFS